MSLPPTTFHIGDAESVDREPDGAIVLALSELEAAKPSASALVGAAEISADWLFSIAPLNIPGPPSALLLRAPARRAGVRTGEWSPSVRAVDWTILQTVQPKCSCGGAGVRIRTFDFPAAFAGKSAKSVILLFALVKALFAAEGCGWGAGGKLLPWLSSTTLSALLEVKKLVLT